MLWSILFVVAVAFAPSPSLGESKVQKYELKGDTGDTIALVEAKASFFVEYAVKDSNNTSWSVVDASKSDDVSGNYTRPNTMEMMVNFGGTPPAVWKLQFERDVAKATYELKSLQLSLPINKHFGFGKAKDLGKTYTINYALNEAFAAPLNQSFECAKRHNLTGTIEEATGMGAALTISALKLQAFAFADPRAAVFGEPVPCKEDEPSPPTPNTTTVAPTTTPKPKVGWQAGNWSVSYNGTPCILLDGKLAVDLWTNKTGTPKHTTVRVPKSATVLTGKGKSTCAKHLSPTDDQAVLALSWDGGANELLLRFGDSVLLGAKKGYLFNLFQVEVTIGELGVTKLQNKVNMTTGEGVLEGVMSAPNGRSFACSSDQNSTIVKDRFNLATEDLKVQAFVNSTAFNTPEVCGADTAATSDLVPIIVGAALAALVVVVLIAYLIGRARAKRQGYASV